MNLVIVLLMVAGMVLIYAGIKDMSPRDVIAKAFKQ